MDMRRLILTFILLLGVLAPAGFVRAQEEPLQEPEPQYLINEIEVLNEVRALERDLKRLKKEIAIAEQLIDRLEKDYQNKYGVQPDGSALSNGAADSAQEVDNKNTSNISDDINDNNGDDQISPAQ